MTPEYCFVLGCARSGTTAMVRLLHAHPNVVVGSERYKYLVNNEPDGFGPHLFTAERFLDFRPTDTNITPEVERFRKHYEKAARRFADDAVRVVGDKLMCRKNTVALLHERIEPLKVVFIYRDLLRVASSFTLRARDPNDTNWLATSTHEVALERWNEAFDAISMLDATSAEVFTVRYESLFNGDVRTCRALFRFLDLDVTPEVSKHFQVATARWEHHRTKPLALTTEQIAVLDERLDRDRLAAFDERSMRLIEKYAG